MKFKLGMAVVTSGVDSRAETDPAFKQFILDSLFKRHAEGDWGEMDPVDIETNEAALKAEQEGKDTSRLFSAYFHEDGTKIWIITEWDRSVTTVLFPSEY